MQEPLTSIDERATTPRWIDPSRAGGAGELVRLAAPIVVSTASSSLMSVVDTAFAGRLGPAEVAAVGLGGVVVWVPYALLNGTLSSVNTFVAQRFGAGDLPGCARFTWQGLYLAAVGVLPALALALFAVPLYASLTAPDIAPLAAFYTRIRVFAVWAFSFIMVFEGFWRGLGDTRTPMRITVAANLLNVAATYMLMFGPFGLPRLGVAGAAWGTLIAQSSALAAHIWLFLRAPQRRGLATLPPAPPSGEPTRRLLWVGVPVGVTWLLDMGSYAIFTIYVGTFGTTALAVTTIVVQIQSLSFMQMIAVGQAGTTLVGQYIGAGRKDLAMRSGISALRVGALYGIAVGVLFLATREHLIELFNRDPDIVRLGGVILLYSAAMQLFDGAWIVTSGALRGAGDTRFSLWCGIIVAWFIFLPLTYGLGTGVGLGLHGAWTAMVVWAAIGAAAHVPRFLLGTWQRISI
jgi:putative MATE family efflux protein